MFQKTDEGWVVPMASNIPCGKTWADGLDLAHMISAKAFRSKAMRMPITKWDGKQVQRMFSPDGCKKLWEHPEIVQLEGLLEHHQVFKQQFQRLKQFWDTVGELFRCVHQPAGLMDMDDLHIACDMFCKSVQSLIDTEDNSVPKPFKYGWNAYDHIVETHI